ncbi:MAG: DUF1800 domain-containing protein [Betaproteobacteria bacterium]
MSIISACTAAIALLAAVTLPGCAAPNVVADTPPALAAPMGSGDARHLLARTGFGATAAEVRAYSTLSREDAIDRLLADARTTSVTPFPAWAAEGGPLRPAADATADERKAFRQAQAKRGVELRDWWMREMLATPSPLTERMTLFWHNHFVSSQQKVRAAQSMLAQNVTLRAHALGNFGTLLHAAAKDPAMVVYLDSAQNRKGAPNENFAREAMELFTLGQGRYGEQDVKEAARAFTGWSVDRATGAFVFRSRQHDDDEKTVLGHRGRFDGDDVLDLLLARDETARFVVDKLWREFVSPVPDAREAERIARAFRDSGYEIKDALRGLLRSRAFWAKENRGVLFKSPVDLVVGTLRQLELSPPDARPLARIATGMGQNLFAPPNVRGWPGGETWINSNTLLARKQYLDGIARRDEGAAFDAAAWLARREGATPDARLEAARTLLLPIAAQRPATADADAAAAAHALLLDPAYQLR